VLALDDERKTFHPLQFDQKEAGTPKAPTLVRETWFAGMHSDVGGGYPDDAVAMDPLLWIMEAAADEGLRFAEGARGGFCGAALSQGADPRFAGRAGGELPLCAAAKACGQGEWPGRAGAASVGVAEDPDRGRWLCAASAAGQVECLRRACDA
jgi:hypothetical protein